MNSVPLAEIVNFLDTTLQVKEVIDYPNACNGLQLANRGTVTRIAGAVDANIHSIQSAIKNGADLLVVHHGLTFGGVQVIVGPWYDLYCSAIEANLAIYSAHLPLDSHPQYSHNVGIAKALGLSITGTFAPYHGRSYGIICPGLERDELEQRLQKVFPRSLRPICYGSEAPKSIGILSGSGGQTLFLEALVAAGVDTLVTGEVHYSAVSFAQLHHLNLFCCGHYATESFGVHSLMALLQTHTQLPCTFLEDFSPF